MKKVVQWLWSCQPVCLMPLDCSRTTTVRRKLR